MLYSQAPALFIAWLIWCLVHSLLASRRGKRWLAVWPGIDQRRYRLIYVIFSVISLAALLAWQFATINLPAPTGPAWQLPRLLLLGYGLFMLAAGGRAYDLNEFLGLVALQAPPGPSATNLRRDGILGRVRHPWYSGGIALAVALGQTPLDRLDWRLLLCGYLVLGCLIEERRLVAELGEDYRRYQREVPMLIPRIRPGTG